MIKDSYYRADIDGLRSIAVLSVVAYHYGATQLSGGFTGVDIFFVISGFLITGILKRDIEVGAFSLTTFYDRRIRRIVPALLTVLVATLLVGWFVLNTAPYADLAYSAAFAAFGLSNLYFFWNSGYFDTASEFQPLLHTWSLGVEEQFYFAWPICLFLALTFIKSRRVLAMIGITLVVLSLAYAELMLETDPTGAFYLPLPRAWELAVGALIAFFPSIKGRALCNAANLLGLALILWSIFAINSSMAFPGFNAVYAVAGAGLIVWKKARRL